MFFTTMAQAYSLEVIAYSLLVIAIAFEFVIIAFVMEFDQERPE